jgi:hypothetical protein
VAQDSLGHRGVFNQHHEAQLPAQRGQLKAIQAIATSVSADSDCEDANWLLQPG